MSLTLRAIAQHAEHSPRKPALSDHSQQLDYATLQERIHTLAAELGQTAPRMVALHADNSVDWVVADLALLSAGIPCIPLPLFFTPQQLEHACTSSGAEVVITDQSEAWLARGAQLTGTAGSLSLLALPPVCGAQAVHPGTAKITFTSGSTGQPKGVCLPQSTLDAVASSLASLVRELAVESHLCLLPLPILLENVAGVYCALQAGVLCHVPSLAVVGLSGSQRLDLDQLLHALQVHQPHSIILLPQMLKAIVGAIEGNAKRPDSLKLVAVGGARISSGLIERARALGVPVYEGYGLSECGSVVAVNRPGADLPGSVGRPLPHVRLDIASDGEIRVIGPHYLGYLGGPAANGESVSTGDLGWLDDAGLLHIAGRSKHLIISSFGRNISPEWVEGELLAQPGILQCVVHGEAKPWLSALLVAPALDDAALSRAVDTANQQLPDYARIQRWLRADAPFSAQNGQFTSNGRPVRNQIFSAYASRLDALYSA